MDRNELLEQQDELNSQLEQYNNRSSWEFWANEPLGFDIIELNLQIDEIGRKISGQPC